MELWQVAVTLGKALPSLDETPHTATPAPPAAGPPPPAAHTDTAMRRYEAIRRRRAGLPELPEDDDRPAPTDPALATLITTNAPERLR